MKTLLLILLILPLWVNADDHKPTAKEVARIQKIELDFQAHFIQAMSASSQGVSSVYWTFVKLDPTVLFKAFMFSVPANATDQSVVRAIVSSMQTEQFDEVMIQKMAQPSPSPTGSQINIFE